MLGRIEYPERALLGNREAEARKAAQVLDPGELDYRRTLLTTNLDAALAEHARWRAEYG